MRSERLLLPSSGNISQQVFVLLADIATGKKWKYGECYFVLSNFYNFAEKD
jgi:hypothetical protein